MRATPQASFAIAIIVVAEMAGTSLWFSVNAVAEALREAWSLDARAIGHLTSAVQAGFITGTFLFAITGLADRYSASRVFAVCAILGALANAAFATLDGQAWIALALRFLTGVTLAGIYPIGMKLVMGWAPERAGQMLGWLVGMLALGTGLPHLLSGVGFDADWRMVLFSASALAVLAGLAVAWLGNGPHHAKRAELRWGRALQQFRNSDFRAAALGYFGHMWELYAFWAVAPFLVAATGIVNGNDASLVTFLVFAAGAVGCIGGGLLSQQIGNARVAIGALAGSALLCAIYPLLDAAWPVLMVGALVAWGAFVVADSPQFSALAAAACDRRDVGAALALMNSVGFSITIIAIELTIGLLPTAGAAVGWVLLPGPLFGLWAMRRATAS